MIPIQKKTRLKGYITTDLFHNPDGDHAKPLMQFGIKQVMVTTIQD